MLSFYNGGHVLFQQAATRHHYSSSFLLGEMKAIQGKLEGGGPPPPPAQAGALSAGRSWAPAPTPSLPADAHAGSGPQLRTPLS